MVRLSSASSADEIAPAADACGEARRRVRADALENEAAILEAAKEVFISSGVDAPSRLVAAAAGVGVGTLYRRFPTRSDLVAAVFRREVDGCADESRALASRLPADQALEAWLIRYVDFLMTKKGLAKALHSGESAFEDLPLYFKSRFEPALNTLLQAASAEGHVRSDMEASDLLRAIAGLSAAAIADEDPRAPVMRMLGLLIDGLRYGAPRGADERKRPMSDGT